MSKQRVAVFFGGRSPEHDVSIITGLQVLDALRTDLFDTIPVYVSSTGEWFTGDALRDKQSYIPGPEARRKLTSCYLGHSIENRGVLIPARKGLFGGAEIPFDVAIPAFHGAVGEDGSFQGLMEAANVPYTGMRVLGSAIAMDKAATKALVQARTSAPQLPFVAVHKEAGVQPTAPALPEGWTFPVIVKPAHMGSSIGVARANSPSEIESILRMIFLYDAKAVVEPYVAQRIEYNIAVKRHGREIIVSAIEKPKSESELLDFKEKYVRGSGAKKAGTSSEGMLSLTRELNPEMPVGLARDVQRWASEIFLALDGTGSPRLDFIFDVASGEIWFNEINPCPGSFAHFLWEASSYNLLFSDLLIQLVEEAKLQKDLTEIAVDPVPTDARLFPRN